MVEGNPHVETQAAGKPALTDERPAQNAARPSRLGNIMNRAKQADAVQQAAGNTPPWEDQAA